MNEHSLSEFGTRELETSGGDWRVVFEGDPFLTRIISPPSGGSRARHRADQAWVSFLHKDMIAWGNVLTLQTLRPPMRDEACRAAIGARLALFGAGDARTRGPRILDPGARL